MATFVAFFGVTSAFPFNCVSVGEACQPNGLHCCFSTFCNNGKCEAIDHAHHNQ